MCLFVCLFSCGPFLFNQLKEQTETNKQRMENCNSLYLCSVLMPRNISVGGMCLKTDMEVTKVKQNSHVHHLPPATRGSHCQCQLEITKKRKKKKEKQCSHKKLCTTNGVVNKTSVCVFVTKRLLNNLYLIPFCTT